MYQRLFLGKKLIKLKEVNSTNDYLKQLINETSKEIEGMIVFTGNQLEGRGQKGTVWKSEKGKNLTFSIFLRPNIVVKNQFIVSKIISLGIIDFLTELGLDDLKIKWPNDVYCRGSKISGILIENSIKGDKINSAVVGIGLNVNQLSFDLENKPTSILKELGGDLLDLDILLDKLLFFIEKRYMLLKSGDEELIDRAYLASMYWFNETRKFKIGNEVVEGIIVGVNLIGKLELKVEERIESLDLKEITFLKEPYN